MDNNQNNNFNGTPENNSVNPNAQPASEASGKTVDDVLAQMRRTAEAQSAQAHNNQQNAQYQPQSSEQNAPQSNQPPHFNDSSRIETPFNSRGQYTSRNQQQYTQDNPQNGDKQSEQQGFARYQNTTSSFSSAPRETVYIDSSKKQKAPKARLGAGAVAALVLVCMLFSGGAAFAGTFIANKLSPNASSGSASQGNPGTPSVIFQSYDNKNKTPGTYEQVADAVAATVVEITTESVSTGSYMWGSNYVISGAGSGVIISADGLIITNNHVVSGATTVTVRMNNGKEYPAKILGADSDSDIAVIKIEATGLPCALVGNSDSLKVGEEVLAVGNPLGEFGGSVTNGIISGLSRSVNIDGTTMTLLQTNAAVNPGNSGGGLFNLYGELIGIVNAKSSTSSSGTSVEGIGFAIPINKASEVATELVNYGYVRGRVYIGITFVDVTNQWDAMSYRVNALGVYVVSSEFEENKFQSGDRIVAINDQAVEFSQDIKSALKDCKVGDKIVVKVVRNGQYVDVDVTLHEYVPTQTQTEATTPAFRNNGSADSASSK